MIIIFKSMATADCDCHRLPGVGLIPVDKTFLFLVPRA